MSEWEVTPCDDIPFYRTKMVGDHAPVNQDAVAQSYYELAYKYSSKVRKLDKSFIRFKFNVGPRIVVDQWGHSGEPTVIKLVTTIRWEKVDKKLQYNHWQFVDLRITIPYLKVLDYAPVVNNSLSVEIKKNKYYQCNICDHMCQREPARDRHWDTIHQPLEGKWRKYLKEEGKLFDTSVLEDVGYLM
jgi:hypothetical protein